MESAFRDTCPDDLRVIETFGYEPGAGPVRRPQHLQRMAATCARLGVPFDVAAAQKQVGEVAPAQPARLRLTVGLQGDIALDVHPLAATRSRWRLCWADTRIQSDDPWLAVKTTRRGLYDALRAGLPADLDELLLLNQRGEVCEGTITNVFLQTGDGLATPPASSGLLPGILRQALLETGRAYEKIVTQADVVAAEQIFVGNSLRGLIPADLVAPSRVRTSEGSH